MNEQTNAVQLLERLIEERKEHFLHALSECAEQSLLSHLKNDIDFLIEKRNQLQMDVPVTIALFQ